MRRGGVLLSGAMALVVVTWMTLSDPAQEVSDRNDQSIKSEAAFNDWVNERPERSRDFADLSSLLKREGVADVVPVRTLIRGDAKQLARCKGAGFVLPPRSQWRQIVPALKIVRDHVIPAVGPVEVVSVYRSSALNACAGGAKQSRHLRFAAVDLVALQKRQNRVTFQLLCAAWRRAGPRSGWGFGAYFDPIRPADNAEARFHVDGTGWRSWGFSKGAASSGCRLIGST